MHEQAFESQAYPIGQSWLSTHCAGFPPLQSWMHAYRGQISPGWHFGQTIRQ